MRMVTRFSRTRVVSFAGTSALALSLLACGSDRASPSYSLKNASIASLTVGSDAPVFTTTALDSTTMRFGGVADSVVLLNVWATWCTSCREEFAELEQIRAQRATSAVRVIGVSVDQGGSEKVRRFVAVQGTHFPVAHDREARINPVYGIRGLPTTFVLGKDGKVRWMQTGSFLLDSVGMRKALDAAIASAAATP